MNDDKTFEYKLIVSIRDNNGYWEDLQEFKVNKNKDKFSLHNLEVDEEGVIFKLTFNKIPTYNVKISRKKNQYYEENYDNVILIKQLMLEIADIVEE